MEHGPEGHEQGGGVVADTGRELAKRDGQGPAEVDPEDEPSAAWGWHGGFRHGSLIAGWTTFLIMVLFNFSNNNDEGHVANIWLTGFALLIALGLTMHWRRERYSWRR